MPDEREHFRVPDASVHEDSVHSTGRTTTYHRPDFGAHGQTLLINTRATRTELAHTHDYGNSSRFLLQVRTPADRPIAREKAALEQSGLHMVALTRSPDRAIVEVSKDGLEALESRILRYATSDSHPYKASVSVIEEISSVPPEQKVDPAIDLVSNTPVPCLLHLHAALPDPEKAAIALTIRNFLTALRRPDATIRPLSTGSTIIETILTPREMLQVGREFATVRLITPNRLFVVSDGVPLGRLPEDVTIAPPSTDIAVAVCDSGILGTSPYIAPLLVQSLPHLPPGAVRPELVHGTFVASRILYGDSLEEGIRLRHLSPACRLIDVPLLGLRANGSPAGTTEAHLAQAIDAALDKLPPFARVVNASLGTNEPIRDYQYSVVANVLDYHARAKDLVVVATAGNIRDQNLIRRYPHHLSSPEWRLDSPGEAALALTVGSIAHFTHPNAVVSTPRSHSPFSRRGPGADGDLKPELVAHGGNYFRTDPPFTSRIAPLGIHADGHQIACDIGTSFAAPLVSRDAAMIFGHFDGATANLVRALLCHFAKPAKAPSTSVNEHHLVGFGEPDLPACIAPRAHSATFLHWGRLKTNVFRYIPFFVPSAFVSGPASRHLRIRATIVLNPPVNAQSPLEYVQSRVTVSLRKRQELGFRDVALSECSVDTGKWSPIECFERPFRRGYSAGPWELRLRLWTRALPDDFEQDYAMAIEVIDDSHTCDVWADVEAEAGAVFRPAAVRVAAA